MMCGGETEGVCSDLFISHYSCVLSRRGVAVDLSKDHKPENKEELQRIEAAVRIITDH